MEEDGTTRPVVVYKVQGNVEANVIKSLLESYDVACYLTSDITQGEFPFTVDGLGEVRITVSAEDEHKAKQIIEEHLSESGDGT